MTNPTLALIPSAYKASQVYSILPSNGDGDFTFTRASFATRVNSNGLIESATEVNVPRLDYSGGGCPSLLLEPQRTNLIPYSEDFTQWTDLLGIVVTENNAISPNGALNATRLDFNPTATDSSISLTIPSGGAGVFVFSVWAKSVSGLNVSFGMEVGNTGGFENQKIATNEWQRFEIISTPSGSVNMYPQIESWTLNNESIYIWGAQLEESYATSYIPTNGSIATRIVEVSSVDLTSFALTSITETINGVEQTPITTIPSTYTMPFGNINKVIMI